MLKELTIYQKHYDLMLYAIPQIQKYPRSHRFTLGQQTHDLLLVIARLIARANKERDKAEVLDEIDMVLDELRLLIRLAKDLKLLPVKQYGIMGEKVSEVGRLLGGWMKSAAKKAPGLLEEWRDAA